MSHDLVARAQQFYAAAVSDPVAATEQYLSEDFVLVNGRRVWQVFEPLAVDDGDFQALGEAFAATGKERQGPIGAATGRLMRAREIVDFAVPWLEANRREQP